MTKRRVVQFNRQGKAIALYNSLEEASRRTGYDKSNIAKSILGIGNKYIFNTYFQWEVTNQELRAKKKEKDIQKANEKLEKLEKEFHIK